MRKCESLPLDQFFIPHLRPFRAELTIVQHPGNIVWLIRNGIRVERVLQQPPKSTFSSWRGQFDHGHILFLLLLGQIFPLVVFAKLLLFELDEFVFGLDGVQPEQCSRTSTSGANVGLVAGHLLGHAMDRSWSLHSTRLRLSLWQDKASWGQHLLPRHGEGGCRRETGQKGNSSPTASGQPINESLPEII